MPTTQYIGSRYVPLLADPVEWSSTKEYEPLTIVTHEGNSYTSRQFVPKDIDIANATYWALTGNYNAQVELYRRETAQAVEQINDWYEDAVTEYADKYGAKPFAFANVTDMQNARDLLYVGAICHTNGFHASGDGGAAWYVIGNTGDANGKDVIACGATLRANLVVTDGFVTPEMFGAFGNGATDDSEFIQAAIDFGNSVVLNEKTYAINATININKRDFSFIGKSRKSRLYQIGNSDILNIIAENLTLEHLTLECAYNIAQKAIVMNQCYYLHGDDIRINECAYGIYVASGATSTNNANDYFSNFEITNYSVAGIYIEGSVDIYFNTFMLHAYQNHNANGIVLKNKVESAIFSNGEVFRGTHGLLLTADNYDASHRPRNVPSFNRFTNVYFDTTIDSCEITTCRSIVFDSCWFSCGWSGDIAKPAVHLYRAWNITFNGCNFVGGAGGLYDDVSVTDIKIIACTFHSTNAKQLTTGDICDIKLAYAQRVLIDTCSLSDNVNPNGNAADYGIYISNAAHFIKVFECLFEGHKKQGLFFDVQSTAQLEVYGCIGAADYTVNPVATLFNNANTISYKPKVVAGATVGNVFQTLMIGNASQNLFALISLNVTSGVVNINRISGTVDLTASYDTDTKILTITPSSTLWNQTKIWD